MTTSLCEQTDERPHPKMLLLLQPQMFLVLLFSDLTKT